MQALDIWLEKAKMDQHGNSPSSEINLPFDGGPLVGFL